MHSLLLPQVSRRSCLTQSFLLEASTPLAPLGYQRCEAVPCSTECIGPFPCVPCLPFIFVPTVPISMANKALFVPDLLFKRKTLIRLHRLTLHLPACLQAGTEEALAMSLSTRSFGPARHHSAISRAAAASPAPYRTYSFAPSSIMPDSISVTEYKVGLGQGCCKRKRKRKRKHK